MFLGNINAYQSQLSWHSCVHQATHFRALDLCELPCACDSNPHQKGSVGTDVYFPSHQAKTRILNNSETVEDDFFIYINYRKISNDLKLSFIVLIHYTAHLCDRKFHILHHFASATALK